MSSYRFQVSADKEDKLVKGSSNQEPVGGGDVASPAATVECFDHGPRIYDEKNRCWSEMSCSQRETEPEDAHIFEGFSSFLENFKIRYCNVFTNEQIWEVAKRDWAKLLPSERAKISAELMPKRLKPSKPRIARKSSRPKVTKKCSKPKPRQAQKPKTTVR